MPWNESTKMDEKLKFVSRYLDGCRLVSTPSTAHKTFSNIATLLSAVCRSHANFCVLNVAYYSCTVGFRKKSIANATTGGSMWCGPLNSKEVTS